MSSLYADRGYLRFNVQPEVTVAPGDSLDLAYEIFEGEVYEFGDVRIAGNTRTKEHVIRREIRTVPGQPYSRQAIERSIRELSTLNYFDPASFGRGPDTEIDDDDRTIDLVYNLSETSSDQLELSGGYGGASLGLLLTARVTFTNFSLQNLLQGFKGGLPTGDGQQLSLQVQTYGTRSQRYSVSFTEPWFRGRPTPVGFALSYQRYAFNGIRYGTTSANLFYRQRLKWPDDYFQTGTSVGYRLYDVSGLTNSVLPRGHQPGGDRHPDAEPERARQPDLPARRLVAEPLAQRRPRPSAASSSTTRPTSRPGSTPRSRASSRPTSTRRSATSAR